MVVQFEREKADLSSRLEQANDEVYIYTIYIFHNKYKVSRSSNNRDNKGNRDKKITKFPD